MMATDSIDLEKGIEDGRVGQFDIRQSPTESSTAKESWDSQSTHVAQDSTTVDSPAPSSGIWPWLRRKFSRAPRDDDVPLKREDDPYRKIVVKPVHGGPLGYPLMARFLDSDENFMTYRRFGHVQSRLLLEAQDDLRRLESQLEDLDYDDTEADEKALCSRSLENTRSSKERQDLMAKIKTAYKEYAELMNSAQLLMSMNRPTSAEFASVENFMNNEKPTPRDEFSFVYHKEDLVTLRAGRDHAWLDSQIEKMLRVFDGWLIQKLFCSSETAQKKGSSTAVEVYFTRERIEMCVNVVLTLMILVLMVVPIYVLYHLTSGPNTPRTNTLCMGVLIIFTLCFSAGLSFFTRAKRHEILAAAAGYCAVLVVFIGNVSGRGAVAGQ